MLLRIGRTGRRSTTIGPRTSTSCPRPGASAGPPASGSPRTPAIFSRCRGLVVAHRCHFCRAGRRAAAFALAARSIASPRWRCPSFHASAGHIRSAWLRGLLGGGGPAVPGRAAGDRRQRPSTPRGPRCSRCSGPALWRPPDPWRSWPCRRWSRSWPERPTPLGAGARRGAHRADRALGRVTRHAVTVGLRRACCFRLPVIRAAHNSRRATGWPVRRGALASSPTMWSLPALGWHLDRVAAGRGAARIGAALLVGCVLAAVFGAIAMTQPARVRAGGRRRLGCGAPARRGGGDAVARGSPSSRSTSTSSPARRQHDAADLPDGGGRDRGRR